jgi:hypothetical protein
LSGKFSNRLTLWVRLCLVALPGFSLWFIVSILNLKSGYFLHNQQNVDNVNFILFLSSIAFLFSVIGWEIGYRVKVLPKNSFIESPSSIAVFFFAIIVAVLSAHLSGVGRGVVLSQGYGSLESGAFNIGMFPYIALFFLMVATHSAKTNSEKMILAFAVVYIIGYEFLLKGRRLEVLAYFVYFISFCDVYGLSKERLRKLIFFGVGLVIFLAFWGLARSSLSNAITAVTDSSGTALFANSDGFVVLPTISNISLTTLLVVDKVENGMPLLLGNSYLDFIPRTLPQFIYPDRPKALSSILTLQGGLHEISEAYVNLSIFGVALIPFLISFMGGVIQKTTESGLLFTRLLYFSYAICLVRGVWYQTFTLYKSLLFSIVFIFIIYVLISLFNHFFHQYKK